MLTTHTNTNQLRPVNNLIKCIDDVRRMMTHYFIQLNEDKTNILLVDSKALRQQTGFLQIHFPIKPTEHVKNLDVIIDADLNFKQNVSYISKTAFYYLGNISKKDHSYCYQFLKSWLMH